MTGVGVGVLRAGNVLWAYLQVLESSDPRGVAWEGPICARRVDAWPEIDGATAGSPLVEEADGVLSSDVSVVAITTSPDAHAELVRRALEAGKHVVCEKPVSMSRAEAEPLFALAADRGLHLLAALFVQLSPSFRDLWTRVADGAIGASIRPGASTGTPARPGRSGSTPAVWGLWPRPASTPEEITALVGPIAEVYAAEATALASREDAGRTIDDLDPDVSHSCSAMRQGCSSPSRARRSSGITDPASSSTGPRARPTCSATTGTPWASRSAERGWPLGDLRAARCNVALGRRSPRGRGLRGRVSRPAGAPQSRPPPPGSGGCRPDLRSRGTPRRRLRRGTSILDLKLVVDVDRHHLHDHTRPFDQQ